MKSRKAIAAATLLTLGLGMAGCGSFEGEATGESDGSKTLTIALQFAPVAGYATESDDAFILSQLGCLETLVRYNYETAELEPVLATEWKQTKPTQWDFSLRSGVKFQDGTDLNADAVVTALTHLLESETPPRSFGPSTIAKVEAVDASTVRITTPTASALVPNRMATTWTGILAPAAYEGDGVDPMKNCTGPYTPVSEAAGQSITLEANSTYWGGAPGLDKVEGRFLGEAATRATQVQTGESQIAIAIPSASQVEIEKNPDLKLVKAIHPADRRPVPEPRPRAVQLRRGPQGRTGCARSHRDRDQCVRRRCRAGHRTVRPGGALGARRHASHPEPRPGQAAAQRGRRGAGQHPDPAVLHRAAGVR